MSTNNKLPYVLQLIKENSTKVLIYMSTRSYGDDYDPYTKNYTYINLNPRTIKGYVTEISPEALVWKSYGLKEMGAKEIICEKKYADWFRKANKIEIDGDSYEVYREGVGNRAIIQQRPYSMIRVLLEKRE